MNVKRIVVSPGHVRFPKMRINNAAGSIMTGPLEIAGSNDESAELRKGFSLAAVAYSP